MHRVVFMISSTLKVLTVKYFGAADLFLFEQASPGRHCHSTLPLLAIGCHSSEIHTVILLPRLSCFAKMAVSPPPLR